MNLKYGNLSLQIMLFSIIGIILGIFFNNDLKFLETIGIIFFRLIQATIIPLIFCSITYALGAINFSKLKNLGTSILFWFSITTIISSAVGIILGLIFNPGRTLSLPNHSLTNKNVVNSVHSIILSFVPQNIFTSVEKNNIGQIVIFSILLGIVISISNTNGQFDFLLKLTSQLNQLSLKFISLIMNIAPLGIGCSLYGIIAKYSLKILFPSIFFITIYGFATIILVTALLFFTSWKVKINIKILVKGIANILLVAFTTASSAVTLPIELNDIQKKLHISKYTSELVLPLGMALNSNGLAMYLSMVCVTITQIYNIPLNIFDLIKYTILATLLCIGTVTVPGGGIVSLTIAVSAFKLPPESITIFSSIDWFIGMFRTTANVTSDVTTAVLIDKKHSKSISNL